MSIAQAQSQHNETTTPAPSTSTLPPLSSQEAKSLRGAIGLGLVITMPLLMIIPPRRFNGITALQMGMFGFGANELLDYRTGQSLLWWAGKPYRWVRGLDDSDMQNQRLQARLNKRRQRKEEEVKRQIAEEAASAAKDSTNLDVNLGSTNPTKSSISEPKGRWMGREG